MRGDWEPFGSRIDRGSVRNTSLLHKLLDHIKSLLCLVADPVGRLLHN